MFQIKFGQARMSPMIICAPLDAKPLCIFLKMKGPSLTLRQDSVCSSVMTKISLAISFMIQWKKKTCEKSGYCFYRRLDHTRYFED